MKERLTGAMILVALIVLLVPELLSGPIRPAAMTAATGSSAEDAPLRSYTLHLADDTQTQNAPAAAPLPATAAAPANESPPPQVSGMPAPAPPPQDTPVASEPTAPSPPPPPARAARPPVPMARPVTPPPSGGGYVVQLGSFASEANAERLAQQVRTQGFTVAVSQSGSGRHLYRVRVGPVRDRAAASQLAQKLSADGHAGSIEPR